MFDVGSYMVSFTRPVSMTATMSGMVMDVSATLVAQMTLRFPSGGGGKTRRWSAGVSEA